MRADTIIGPAEPVKWNLEVESQQHVLKTCPHLHQNIRTMARKSEIFDQNIDNLRNRATKLENILKTIDKNVMC